MEQQSIFKNLMPLRWDGENILYLAANKKITLKPHASTDRLTVLHVMRNTRNAQVHGTETEYSSILGSIRYVRLGEDKPSVCLLKGEARIGLRAL